MKQEEVNALTALLAKRIAPAAIAGFSVDASLPPSFPESEAEAVKMAAGRAKEFLAGRAATALALASVGAPVGPVLRGASGEPLWPEGFSGSLTHGAGIALAAAAPKSAFRALGIDVESTGRLGRRLWKRLFTPEEAAFLQSQKESALAATAAFSAKEAVYKALFHASGRGVEMKEIALSLRPDGTFEARLRHAADFSAPERLSGFFLVSGTATFSFTALPA